MPVLKHIQGLRSTLPWIQTPLVISAPMKNIAGPKLAVTASEAGGIGFIGPWNEPEDLRHQLKEASELVQQSKVLSSFFQEPTPLKSQLLPVGIGVQTWTGDLKITLESLSSLAPAIVWLFAPRHGQQELDEWTRGIRQSSPKTQVWIQIGSVAEAYAAAESSDSPDVLVIQGADAGGHSRTQGSGIVTLLPEVTDALKSNTATAKIPLIAAGGLIDARGFAAVLALGASGVAMGTRFLASKEAIINLGYQRHVLTGGDGGQITVKTQLYNHLRGTMGWPEEFDARTIINQSWRDHQQGMPFEKNKNLYEEAMKHDEVGWGENGRMATYAGTGIGLVTESNGAAEIIKEVRNGVRDILQAAISISNV